MPDPVNPTMATAQTSPAPAGPSDTPPVRPALSLQAKAICCVVLLIAAATGLSGYLIAASAQRVLVLRMKADADLLLLTTSRVLAHQLASRVPAELEDQLKDMIRDPRIGFIVVTDAQGRPLSRLVDDPVIWQAYVDHVSGAMARWSAATDMTVRTGGSAALIRGCPIWSAASVNLAQRDKLLPRLDPARLILGYVWIGFHDRNAAGMMHTLHVVTLGIICATCLVSLPLVILLVRRLSRPLRRVIGAIHQLSRGHMPDPLPVDRDDEIGALLAAFNVMAENLTLARRQLEQTNSRLEDLVQQRTAELQKINRKLQQEMQDKDEFVRTVSHDLNAPVRNIAGMTKMILLKHEHELSRDVLAKLQRIAANARVESELLADLLELNRLKSQPGKCQTVCLDELLASIADSLEYDLQTKGIELVISPRLPVLCADRNRIRQVFQNLIDNAIKYMPPDAPVRRIEVGQCDQDNHFAFYVKDTGRGIDPKDQHRIFQVFQRARYSGHQPAGGRGVGLASVKTIVESYGGRLWVYSQPPHGATFFFTFDPSVFSHCPLEPAPAGAPA